MTHDHSRVTHHREPAVSQGSFWISRTFLVSLGFLAIVVTLLFTEHRAHVLGVLPYLFLLACPLLHFFMHGSHGSHRNERSERDRKGDWS